MSTSPRNPELEDKKAEALRLAAELGARVRAARVIEDKAIEDAEFATSDLSPETSRSFTAAELQAKTFSPLQFAVPGLLPQGAALLVGPPKIGKSRLALGLACAVAYGGVALSYSEVQAGGVLYLALEDGERRLRERMEALHHGHPGQWPETLRFATEWPRIGEGGREAFDLELRRNPGTRLIIVDVLQMVRPTGSGRETNSYAADYAVMRELKAIADEHNVALVAVHHTRKLDAADPVALISGTNGVAGAVDSLLIMQKAPNGGAATLYLRGRDIEENQYTLNYERETGAWAIAGETRAEPLSETREKIVTVLEREYPHGMTAKAIATATGLADVNVRQRIMQLEQAGKIVRVSRGLYAAIAPGPETETQPPLIHSNNSNNDNKSNKSNKSNNAADADNKLPVRYSPEATVTNGVTNWSAQQPRNHAESASVVTVVTVVTPTDDAPEPVSDRQGEHVLRVNTFEHDFPDNTLTRDASLFTPKNAFKPVHPPQTCSPRPSERQDPWAEYAPGVS